MSARFSEAMSLKNVGMIIEVFLLYWFKVFCFFKLTTFLSKLFLEANIR